MDLLDQPGHRRGHQISGGQQPHHPRTRGQPVVDDPERHEDPIARILGQVRTGEALDQAVQQRDQKLVLVAHVPVQRHRGAIELLGHPPHSEPVDAIPIHDRCGRVDHRRTGQARRPARSPRTFFHTAHRRHSRTVTTDRDHLLPPWSHAGRPRAGPHRSLPVRRGALRAHRAAERRRWRLGHERRSNHARRRAFRARATWATRTPSSPSAPSRTRTVVPASSKAPSVSTAWPSPSAITTTAR